MASELSIINGHHDLRRWVLYASNLPRQSVDCSRQCITLFATGIVGFAWKAQAKCGLPSTVILPCQSGNPKSSLAVHFLACAFHVTQSLLCPIYRKMATMLLACRGQGRSQMFWMPDSPKAFKKNYAVLAQMDNGSKAWLLSCKYRQACTGLVQVEAHK